MTKPLLVDLFSGCGGFGLGGELAGFHSAIAVDVDPTLQSSYKLNFPNTKVMIGDIAAMNAAGWKLLLSGLEVDGVIGGPPCQGYSRQGVADPNDARRTLLHEFFKSVNAISPKFFIMENVEGLLDKKNLPELSSAISELHPSYHVLEPMVLDASNYGLPTKRKRVFVVGYKTNYVDPIHIEDFMKFKDKVDVRGAINDVPNPISQGTKNLDFAWAKYDGRKKRSEYADLMKVLPVEGLGSDLAIKKLREGYVSGNYHTKHTESVSSRYESIEPGKTDPVSRSKRLEWDGFCPTLRAGTGSDKGSYQAVRPLHPDIGRVITVREAARLQSFPDWFLFHHTKWHSFRMIGNSVPPLLSKMILGVLREKCSSVSDSSLAETYSAMEV